MSAIRRPDRGNEWWIDFRWKGQRIRRRSPIQTKAGAVAFEREFVAELVRDRQRAGMAAPFEPTSPAAPVPTLAEFVPRYERNYLMPHQRPSSRATTMSAFRAHHMPFFGRMRLDEIGPGELSAFTASEAERGLRPKTINNHLSMLHCALSLAQEWRILTTVPRVRRVRVPAPAFRYLSHADVRRLLAAANPTFWRPFIAFLVFTGARFGEAAALRWEDLELDGPNAVAHIQRGAARGLVGPTKTGRHRDVPLVADLVRELRAFQHERAYVFCRPNDGKILDSGGATQKYLHKICERAGLKPISWHVLRHTFATELTARGAPLPAVQQLLGHSTIQMTARYAHVAPSTLRASIMLLDA